MKHMTRACSEEIGKYTGQPDTLLSFTVSGAMFLVEWSTLLSITSCQITVPVYCVRIYCVEIEDESPGTSSSAISSLLQIKISCSRRELSQQYK